MEKMLVLKGGKALSKSGALPDREQLGWMVIVESSEQPDLTVVTAFTGDYDDGDGWDWMDVAELQAGLPEAEQDAICDALLVAA